LLFPTSDPEFPSGRLYYNITNILLTLVGVGTSLSD
jgi:hypothetical protein